MRPLLLVLATLLAGCAVYPAHPYYRDQGGYRYDEHRGGWWDHDRRY
jgi:hypothetical protein